MTNPNIIIENSIQPAFIIQLSSNKIPIDDNNVSPPKINNKFPIALL